MTPKIEKIRARIAALKSQIETLKDGTTHIPKADALARVNTWIDQLQERGRKRLTHWLVGMTYAEYRADPFTVNHDPVALDSFIAAVAPEALRATLTGLVEAEYQNAGDQVPAAEVPGRIATLESELLKLERQDFDESRAANIQQRADLDARVLLGVA